jgi:hypothetical protein
MEATFRRPTGRPDDPRSSLTAAIDALDLARDAMNVEHAKDAFSSASVLLTTIKVSFVLPHAGLLLADAAQDSMSDKPDCVEIGLACADVCRVLGEGMDGRRADQPSQPVLKAIERLMTWVGPATCVLENLLIKLSTVGLWPRSRSTSSNGAKGTRFLGVSTRRRIKRRLLRGGWISMRFAVSLTCVPSLL